MVLRRCWGTGGGGGELAFRLRDDGDAALPGGAAARGLVALAGAAEHDLVPGGDGGPAALGALLAARALARRLVLSGTRRAVRGLRPVPPKPRQAQAAPEWASRQPPETRPPPGLPPAP